MAELPEPVQEAVEFGQDSLADVFLGNLDRQAPSTKHKLFSPVDRDYDGLKLAHINPCEGRQD